MNRLVRCIRSSHAWGPLVPLFVVFACWDDSATSLFLAGVLPLHCALTAALERVPQPQHSRFQARLCLLLPVCAALGAAAV